MKYSVIVTGILILFTTGCLLENYFQRELPGEWKGVSWELKDGTPYTNAEGVSFTFREDSTYSAVLGARSESGTWWVDGYKLYTIDEQSGPNIVKVLELQNDTVTFEMNRGGQLEHLILARQ